MRAIITVLTITTLSASALAQTTYQVAPADLANAEGRYYSSRFGTYGAMRIQWNEGELGNSAAAVRGIGFRLDVLSFPWRMYGRKHSDLRIFCAKGDHTSMSATFSANALSTPTMVYSAAFAMPKLTHNPNGVSPWHQSLNLPFRTSYIHAGNSDLLIDSQMSGGTLDNGAPWSASGYIQYNLDSPRVDTRVVSGQRAYFGNGPLTSGNRAGCSDSANTTGQGPYYYTTLHVHSPTSPPALRNRIQASNFGANYPPNTNVATLLGVPNTKGTAFPGVTCNKVYVDLAAAPVFRMVRSQSSHSSVAIVRDSFLGGANSTIPFKRVYQGLALMVQAAFRDTKHGGLRISQAGQMIVPTPRWSIKRMTVHQSGSAQPSTGSTPTRSTFYFPVIRYTR